jgi:hypothetical protein
VESLTRLEQITRSCYVCSKHFRDGAPTSENPYPLPVEVHYEDAAVDADVEAIYWTYIHDKLMNDTPNVLRSNMLYYMAGWAARQVGLLVDKNVAYTPL